MLWRGALALAAVAGLLVWASLGDEGAVRRRLLARACSLLRPPLNLERTSLAKEAFRDATGGLFGERYPFFGLRVVEKIEAVLRGGRPRDPAVAALARGDLRGAERRFRERGGIEARYGQRLVHCVMRRGGKSDARQPQDR